MIYFLRIYLQQGSLNRLIVIRQSRNTYNLVEDCRLTTLVNKIYMKNIGEQMLEKRKV